MARSPVPLASSTGGTPHGGQLPDGFVRGFDRLLAIHRPVVLAHIRAIRRHNPRATPEEIVRVLERRYLTAVTTGGAFVGASAVIPGVGTGITLALSGVETAGFLEATALFAQSVSEVHGLTVDDPDRARALVMTMMLGREGSDLVRQLAGQFTGGGTARTAYWGELITTSLPRTIIGPLTDKLKSVFIRQFAAKGGASLIGKALPFGIGAVIGGTGNHLLGTRVVHSSRLAFGPAPLILRSELEPTIRLTSVPDRFRVARSVSDRATRSLSRFGSGTRALLPGGRRRGASVAAPDPTDQAAPPINA
ncbi:hypothetical protein [Cryobacterium sp. MLB-32]|uniref:hypothetical protein n=1 Tax=Cryobacterium sp. MLB-32 TaxID=1529318 RepID=UPI000B1AA28C